MARTTSDIAPDFGQRLASILQRKNWNQSDLARASGLGRDSISTYVRGMVFPDPKNLKKLADALGCSVSELVPGRDPQPDNDAIFEIRQTSDGRVFVKINQSVSLDQAAKIFSILREEK